MTDYMRVRDKATGHHYTIASGSYDPDGQTELKQDAVDVNGDPLPPKYKTTVDESAGGDKRTSHAGTATSEEK